MQLLHYHSPVSVAVWNAHHWCQALWRELHGIVCHACRVAGCCTPLTSLSRASKGLSVVGCDSFLMASSCRLAPRYNITGSADSHCVYGCIHANQEMFTCTLYSPFSVSLDSAECDGKAGSGLLHHCRVC